MSILNDQELFSNPSQLTSKEILARAENHMRSNRRNGTLPPILHRGEVNQMRPDYNQAYSAPVSAPAHARGPGGSANGSSARQPNERPLSVSTNIGAYPMRQALRSPIGSPGAGGFREQQHQHLHQPQPSFSPHSTHQHSTQRYDGYHPPPPTDDYRRDGSTGSA